MKIKWNKGSRPPEKRGFYLAWNPWEDDFPTVLHHAPNGRYGWWTYHLHRAVIEDTISEIIYPLIRDALRGIASDYKLTKAEKSAVETINSKISAYIERDPDGFDIDERVSELVNSDNVCIYDVGTPKYWAELPNIIDMDGDEKDSVLTGESDPNCLDIEVEDIKAQVINAVAENVQRALNIEMSRLASPWEQDREKAPWSK